MEPARLSLNHKGACFSYQWIFCQPTKKTFVTYFEIFQGASILQAPKKKPKGCAVSIEKYFLTGCACE